VKAMILAAGRGERMRPLTDTTPKPLLPVRGKPLIVWHLEALARAGVRDVVINTAWLEERFPALLGDGAQFGLAIRYSLEGRDHGGALETAGGIAKALPWLGDAFWLVSADLFMPGFGFDPAAAARFAAQPQRQAHLWLVPNPAHNPQGDFGLDADGCRATGARVHFCQLSSAAGVALLRAGLCAHLQPGTHAPLGPLLRAAMHERRVSAEVWPGEWHNVGTPAQWQALQ